MKIEKGIISSSQLMLTVLCFIQGANLAIAFIYNISKRDTWICIITGYIISFIIILFYIALAQKFSDKNLLEIFDCIYGPYLGKVFSAAYILFFFFIMVQNLYFFGNFWLNYLMPETPMVPILIMFVFVCAWAVRNGIEVIARCSFLFVIITAALVVAVTVLLIKDMKFANLLPVFETPFMDLLQGTHVIAAIPLCEVVVFLMIIPYTNNIKQVKRSVLLGLTLGSTQLLITVIRDITVLGPLAYIATSPPFGAVRQIDIANVLTRLDIVIAIGVLLTVFMKVSVYYYSIVLGIAQTLGLKSYVPIVVPVGILAISVAMQFFSSAIDQVDIAPNIWIIYAIPFQLIIPVLSLIIAKMRKLPQKQGEDMR